MSFPRVTEILKPFTSYEHVPPTILARAAARGTTVHALCAGIAKGAWIPDGMIGEEYIGYINSFKKWAEAQVKEFIIVERRYTHDNEEFSGQVDFVVIGTDGELYLVDLKTSARPQKTYPVQMAAYDHLLKNQKINVKAALLVYLDKDGEFPEIHYLDTLTEELDVFLSALECWHYFNRRKKHGRKDPIESNGQED